MREGLGGGGLLPRGRHLAEGGHRKRESGQSLLGVHAPTKAGLKVAVLCLLNASPVRGASGRRWGNRRPGNIDSSSERRKGGDCGIHLSLTDGGVYVTHAL